MDRGGAPGGWLSSEVRPAGRRWGAPLVERERELRALEQLLAGAQDRRGGLLLLEGRPGEGKSRLIDCARHLAEQAEMTVLAARGSEHESAHPFGAVMQLLEPRLQRADETERTRLFAGMARPAAALFSSAEPDRPPVVGESQLTVLHALYWVLGNLAWREDGSEPVPVLIAIDDAQWVDASSLRFVMHLVIRVAELPLAVVLATRPIVSDAPGGEEASRGSSQQQLADLRGRAAVNALRLDPLSERGVQEIVRSACADADAGLAPACARATGGNPFLLIELLQALRAEDLADAGAVARVEDLVPETVLQSVARRVQRLGADAASLARAAAILGDGAALRQAATVAGLGPEAAEAAAEALLQVQILRAGDPLTFEHPLIASAVGAELTELARGQLHRRAAEVLAHDGASLGAVCSHLLAARRWASPWVVETLRQAAREAHAHGEYGWAAQLLARASDEPPPAALRDEVLLELAQAEAASGQPQALDRLSNALARCGEAHRRADALRSLSELLLARADYALAADAAERGLAELGEDDALGRELLGLYMLASSFDPGRRFTQSARWNGLRAAAKRGRLPPEPRLTAQLAAAMSVRWAEPADRVRRTAQAALDGCRFAPDPHGYVVSLAVAGLIYVDELEAAESALAAADERAAKAGSVIALAQISQSRAVLLLRQGKITDAASESERALEICRLGWTAHLGWCAAVLAQACLQRGDAGGAREALRVAETVDRGSLQWALVLHAQGTLALHEDDPASAYARFCAAGAHLEEQYGLVDPMFLDWQAAAAIAAARCGETNAAVRLAGLATERARAGGRPRAIGAALRASGRVTAGEAGADLLAQAVATLEQAPAPLELAQALIDLGAAQRVAGQRIAARESLGRGFELAMACGAIVLADRAHQELRVSGARPRRAARSGVGSLTPTELRIVSLAAAGATNPTIAQQLFITTKTVEWHLTNAYRKLGTHSRKQLSALLDELDRGPDPPPAPAGPQPSLMSA